MNQPFRYAGYWYDAALGWYWLEQRSYDPGLERFLQPDPSQDEGVRVYVYGEDDPLDGIDPLGYGLCEVPLLGGVACTTGRVLHAAWQFVAGDDFQTLTSDASFGEKAFALIDLASNATLLIPIVGEGVEGVKFATKGLYYVGRKLIARKFTKEEIIAALRKGYRTVSRDVAEGCVSRCFPAGTQVATPQGLRPIETLHVGESVLAEDPAKSKVEPEPVQAAIKDPVSSLMAVNLSDGSAITVTANHPFWLDIGAATGLGGWIAAGQLRPGDHLRTASGTAVTVTAVHQNVGQAVVYTLTVAHDHTYFVGTAQVLVHNCETPAGRPLTEHAIESLQRHGVSTTLVDRIISEAQHVYTQADGGTAYVLRQSGRVRRYGVAIVSKEGAIVTALKDLSTSELANLARNYDWQGFSAF